MIYLLVIEDEDKAPVVLEKIQSDKRVQSVYTEQGVMPASRVFLVSFPGTAYELADLALDMKSDEGTLLGAVFRVSGHGGYAETALWDWINTYGKS